MGPIEEAANAEAEALERQAEMDERERRLRERELAAAAATSRAEAAEAALREAKATIREQNDQLDQFDQNTNPAESVLRSRERLANEMFQSANTLVNETSNRASQIKVNIDTPLIDDCPSFTQYEKLVHMWAATTSIENNRLGSILALTIPITSTKHGDLREDLFENVDPISLINNPNGLALVLDYLKIRVGKNEREAQIETFIAFLKYQRRGGQTIEDYVLEFERHYKRCKALDILFNDNVSAFLLLYNANLNEIEYKLIKGTMNIKEDAGQLYDKTKGKLIEMLTNSMGDVVSNQGNIGNEVLLTQHNIHDPSQDISQQVHDVLVAQGWKAPPRYNKYQKNKPYTRPTSYNQHKTQTPQSKTPKRSTNPVDHNGDPLKCHCCESIRHMISECPHAYENQKGDSNKGEYKKGRKLIKREVHYTVVDDSELESGEESDNYQLAHQDPKQGRQNTKSASRIVMFTDNKSELNRFTTECLNHGALDTCCTSCVAGADWVNIYLDALTPELRKLVKGPTPSNKQFMFGNQGTLNSAATYQIPIKIGDQLKMLEIDSIKSDIPLLISMAAMRDLGMILDLKNDRITIDGKPIPVTRTSAGHYTIDLLGNKNKIPVDEIFMIKNNQDQVNLVDLLTADDKTQIKLLDKIHRQFGHRPKDAYIQILKNADKWLDKFSPMIDTIINKCEGCVMRLKTPDRPAVALPLATDFNQVVTMDLKIWNQNKNEYILYLIDAFTRYQVATVINRKTPDQVINGIFEKWIQYFGFPDKILSDNGGEFSNAEMQEVANRTNLKLFTTGAYSPWQNGLCERNHAHTDNILQSVLRDYPQLSLKSALTWACTAKNSLTTIHGFSPFQLVFGRNIRLPNILNDPPPTYEIKTRSKALRDNLTAIHATREAHMKAESCEKLKRALKSKVRTFDHTYQHGDYVYFKRERQEGWEGPARVVFQDNKVILVRQGGFFYKVSANRIKPAHDDLIQELKLQKLVDYHPDKYTSNTKIHAKSNTTPAKASTTTKQKHTTPVEPDIDQTNETSNTNNNTNIPITTNDQLTNNDESEETDNSTALDNTNHIELSDDSSESENEENFLSPEENPPTTPTDSPVDAENPPIDTENKQTTTNKRPYQDNSDSEEEEFVESLAKIPKIRTRNATKIKPTQTKTKPIKFRPKDRIEIKEKNKWQRGIILKAAGKATGKYKDWYNIKLDNGKVFNTNVKHREIRKLSNEEAMLTWVTQSVLAVMVPRAERNSEACSIAKEQELQKLKDFDTYQIVEDKGQDRISTTWVLTEKAETVRARLTCKGFQEEEDFPTDSPTIQKASTRMILTIATTSKWNIKAIDIKSAFLQGDKLTRKVFVKPPREANLNNKLWRLKKCLYGLKDASRQWYLRLKTTLKQNGFQKSIYDGGLFFIIKNDTLIGIVGIHVDDFLATGTDHFMNVIIPNVLKAFLVGKAEDQTFMYTGTKITQDDSGITVDQTEYVQNLEIFDLDLERLKMNRVMDQTETTNLRQYCGSLNWAVGTSRPDLSFQMINLSTNFKGGKVSALKQAHSVMKQLKKKPAYLRISNLNNFDECQLWCYSDAAHRNLNDNTDSAGGYILFIVNTKNGNCAPIEWRSNKIKRRVVSTLAAELLSLVTAIDAAIGTRDQLREITAGKVNLKIKAITDNRSARDTIYSEKANDQKRLRAEIAGVKESIEEGLIEEVKWVPGASMLADILTKQGVKSESLMSVLQQGKMGHNLLNAISG